MKTDPKMFWIVKVQKGGRITIPKELMMRLGWKVGDTLLVKATNGGISLQRVANDK